ncbi:GIY-YIG nuclease family protein [Agarivorans aestuarii]|uniref:GIY-YIG nuclease family protein n=1 Tax=Agarivorans aestuarii TaxID=1563703 RepID=UPI001C80A2CC|nr:GIY-YIG nuclease family protein [Agarivorans aestuarii]
MEAIDQNILIAGVILCLIGISSIIFTLKKRKSILSEATKEAEELLSQNQNKATSLVKSAEQKKKDLLDEAESRKRGLLEEAEQGVIPFHERIERLKIADKEITSRLKQSRAIIEDITDKSCSHAADIELLTEEDLLSSQTYQEDRKEVKAILKKLAVNAIDGVRGSNSNVNIGKFVSISAKADMAGALLLTTVEMLCTKTNANNGHQALEKLAESIIATEALIKCIDSRATINGEFKALLIKRLEIEIHFKKAKQIAKEEQRELREQEREEKKARQEAERIQKEAEKEERIKSEAIAELEMKMSEKSDAERAIYQEELDRLKAELEEAHQKFERAKSRAQETKQGHVYVISNIGSFGEDVLKIGMTRRMEPMDRVKELGDASVPFTFDVHALIESDDAPNLESTLHKIFDNKRVNKVNRRKEYFNVNLDEIEQELQKLDINALINKVASADEYYQSIKLEDSLDKEKLVEECM